jgi:hypothetical protein
MITPIGKILAATRATVAEARTEVLAAEFAP